MIRPIIRVYTSAFSGLPRDVWLLSAVVLINRAGSMVLAFLSLYLKEKFGLTATQAGLLLSCYGVGSAIGAYVGGWLTDKLGADRTQILALALSGLGFLGVPLLTSPAALAAGLFVLAVLNDSVRPAVMSSAAERAPPTLLPRAFALLRLAINTGVGIGAAIGGILANLDYVLLFVCDALTCWGAALLLFRLATPRRAAAPDDASTPADAPERNAPQAFTSPFQDGPFLGLMLVTFVGALVFFQMMAALPLYFGDECGLSKPTIGLLFAWNAVMIVAFEMLLTRWAETKDRMTIVAAGWLFLCAGFGMMPLGAGIPFLALTITVWTFGEMLALPMISAVVAERATPATRGRYMGVYTLSFALAFIASPPVGMWVYQHAGPTVLWFSIGGLAPVLFLTTLFVRRAFLTGGTREGVL